VYEPRLIRELIGANVLKLILRIFPPYAERGFSSADVSLVLQADSGRHFLFSVDPRSNWGVNIAVIDAPIVVQWDEYGQCLPAIMRGEIEPEFDYVFCDASREGFFADILKQKIVSIDALTLGSLDDAFGLKLTFEKDFILIYPNTDGSAVETARFKQGRGLDEFKRLGRVHTTRSVSG
jgi:hypothetical protein